MTITPPAGTDISPGQSLGGFAFVFTRAVGSLPFSATFVNPNDPDNGVVYNGVAVTHATVPEPSSMVLLGTGLAALVVARRRRLRAS